MLKYLFPLLLLLSCSSPIDKQETIHNFQLRLDLSQLPASVASIRGQLSNSNSDLIVFNFDLDTITETATAIVSEIPVGEWQLTVNAMDENEIVTHSASVTVLIHSGLNEVNLIFEAVTGDLVIHAGFQIELNEENTFLYEYHAEDDSLYLQTGYDIDSLISIYEPRLKYGSKLHFQFQSQKYVKSVYMDKWIEVLDDASQFSHHLFFYNQETYNSIIQTFSSENFLEPIIWENNFGYSDTVIRIDFDDPQSSKEYELIIWLIWNPELQQSFPVEKKSTKQLSDLHQRFVKKN